MALAIDFTRPLTAQTETESTSQSAAITEGSGCWYIDITATVNAALRLIGRIKITPIVTGRMLAYEVRLLTFQSTTDTFVPGTITTPFSEAEADENHLLEIKSPGLDLHAMFNTFGDTTAS